jgi:hypothetical protein
MSPCALECNIALFSDFVPTFLEYIMSAFICTDRHIATIATALFADKRQAQAAANHFKRENIRSVNYRYKERTRATKCDMAQAADLNKFTGHDIAAMLNCLDYQSCEHPDRDLLVINLCARILDHQGAKASQSKIWAI